MSSGGGVLTLLTAGTPSSMPLISHANMASMANVPPGFGYDEGYAMSGDMFLDFPPNLNSNTSPLGIDLGEFMFEGDLEFLNQLVSTGTATRATQNG